jgi:hypothetical protein
MYQVSLERPLSSQNEPPGFDELVDGKSGFSRMSFREMVQDINHRLAGDPDQAAKGMVQPKN